MVNWRGSFCVPTRIHYGLGSLEVLAQIGIKNALIISDPFLVKSGMIKNVTDQLDKANINYTIFSDVVPDPTVAVVVSGVAAAQKISPETIIAFGGGSAIDTAKGILYFYTYIKEEKNEESKPRLIVIPTTSGTGSEVTDFAVITDEKAKAKIPLRDKKLMPNHAILDANLVRSLPPAVTADTGIDVLTHAIEAYVSTLASDFTDALAEKAIRIVFDYLPKSYQNGSDDEARVRMHDASTLAGMAFTHTSLGINHSMAHALGGRFHIPHGRANGILLPYVIDYNSKEEKAAARYAEISRLLGLNYMSDIYAAKELRNMVIKLKENLEMPSCFKEIGIPEADFLASIEALAATAMKDTCTQTNPRVPTQEDLEKLFKKAYYGN